MLRNVRLSIVLLCCLALAACSTSALSTAAKIESAASLGCSTAFQIVSQAAASGLIAQADANAIVTKLIVIEQADQQAETATAAIAAAPTSTNSTAANILAIVQPIATAVNASVADGLVGIKDPATKQKVLLALTTAQTAIAAGLAILQAVKS